MNQYLTHISIVVRDYDEAIEFYTKKLHFTLIEDTVLSPEKRWVLVRPRGASECSLLLAKGANAEQTGRIGNQTGGRVFLFLHTDDFKRDFQNLIDHGIRIVRGPSVETYGTVAVFEDLYGNRWDLIEPARPAALFHSTGILRIKDSANEERALAELRKLRTLTLQEPGAVSFDVKQVKDDPLKIILWECFRDEQSFRDHLASAHLQEFVKQDLVELEKGYITEDVR